MCIKTVTQKHGTQQPKSIIRTMSRHGRKSSTGPQNPLHTNGVKTTTSMFTKEQIDKLSQNPQNRVYDYEFDQVDKVLTPGEVRDIARDIRAAYMDIKQAKPSAPDSEIRAFLLVSNPEWTAFAQTSHMRIFDYLTTLGCIMEHLEFMLNLKIAEAETAMTEDKRMETFNNYFHKELDTGLTVEEYEKKMKDQDAQERAQSSANKFGKSTAPAQ